MFEVLNVQRRQASTMRVTTKNGRQVFGRRKVHPERENPGYAYEKRAPALRWYEAPEWLIRPWSMGVMPEINLCYAYVQLAVANWIRRGLTEATSP